MLETLGNPGIIIFDDELGDLRSFTGGEGFKLLDDFGGARGRNNKRVVFYIEGDVEVTVDIGSHALYRG